MIQCIDHFSHVFFQYFEIYSHAEFIKLSSFDCNLDFPIVAMGLFTISGIVPQMMGACKMGLNENIEHIVSLILYSCIICYVPESVSAPQEVLLECIR